MKDKIIQKLITEETKRQNNTLNLIASENSTSKDVREALASVFTNKYAEGYPGARYYGGNAVADKLEALTQARALTLFGLSPKKWSVNVQPYSGSPANLAVLLALVPAGEKIMGMSLAMGGHLTHGHKVSVTGKLWQQVPYGVNKKTERIDYEEVLEIARREQPRIIIAGATAYSRIVDFKKMRAIADAAHAYLMVDMSHFAGLVAGGVYPSPFAYADVVTTTVHKTLRGPRAALIFARKFEIRNPKSETNQKFKTRNSKPTIASAIDKAVFPGLQGGPHMNAITAVAVALKEAGSPTFKKYAAQIVKNTRALAGELARLNWRIISGGTDTHLFLMDTISQGVGGGEASDMLETAGIIVNKNTIPFDERKPTDPSGIRIGTAALTTRGMKEKEMKVIATLIDAVLKKKMKPAEAEKKIAMLCKKFPLR